MALRGGRFSVELVEDRPQQVTLRVSGAGAHFFLSGESGGHRWQHVPEHERHGRRHTSTVTVAILPVMGERDVALREGDLEWDKSFCAGGPGGQHQNKTASACRVRHRPSGLVVECRSERSLHMNKKLALELLRSRLKQRTEERASATEASARRAQVGTGMRGDKIRTYREWDDVVIDEASGRKVSLSKLRKGDWQGLKA